MPVSEVHFSGWEYFHARDENHPSVGKGNDYMTQILIIYSARKTLVSVQRTIHDIVFHERELIERELDANF